MAGLDYKGVFWNMKYQKSVANCKQGYHTYPFIEYYTIPSNKQLLRWSRDLNAVVPKAQGCKHALVFLTPKWSFKLFLVQFLPKKAIKDFFIFRVIVLRSRYSGMLFRLIWVISSEKFKH